VFIQIFRAGPSSTPITLQAENQYLNPVKRPLPHFFSATY
jgi:hypothetical protein